MWTRKQLKERARTSFYRNRWRTVLVSLVTVLYLGALGYVGSTVVSGNLGALRQEISEDASDLSDELTGRPDMNSDGSGYPDFGTDDSDGSGYPDFGTDDSGIGGGSGSNDFGTGGRRGLDDSGTGSGSGSDDSGTGSGSGSDDSDTGSGSGSDDSATDGGIDAQSYEITQGDFISRSYPRSQSAAFSIVIILLTILGMVVVAALALTVVALVVNPLIVGCRRFFFINLNTSARVGELGYAFDTNYRNITRIMLRRTVYTILWSLLFLIPGLVKNYEYMMVPYILAEEPDIDRKRAFAISREMMYGNKWKAFLLDVSFIPWHLLSSITLGIVNIFYVGPYKNMTYAAFYEQMRSNYTQKRMAYTQQSGQNTQQPGQDPQQSWQNAQQPGQNAQQSWQNNARQSGQNAQQSWQNAQQPGQNTQQDYAQNRENRGPGDAPYRTDMGE